MKPLRVSGAMKIAQGFTTPEEVVKVVPLLKTPALPVLVRDGAAPHVHS